MKMARHHGGKHPMERKDGGSVKPKMRGDMGTEEEDKEVEDGAKRGGRQKRARGGAMEHMEGKSASKRHDRPGRKRGGGVGSNLRPLTTAAKTSNAEGHDTEEVEAPE